ncbi:MAG: uroporphyrinogen-III synthase [Zoogloeaceae bacterium]|jgi:uroporphyrinogen-III synthase|nr:uroporphyrinogen-III synthase [Zoogloeaceae bacterium]
MRDIPSVKGVALAGRSIVVTRPRAQAVPLMEAIRAHGGNPLSCPLLEIAAAPDSTPLRAAAATLAEAKLAIFVSPNAARYALPVLLEHTPWPPAVQAAAIGGGTAACLRQAGVPAPLYPMSRSDSEGLLALPECAEDHVRGRRVLLFRGDDGRKTLADTLRARGAAILEISCYQRRGPTPETIALLKTVLASGAADALTLSSSEALAYLTTSVDTGRAHENLLAHPLFTPHPRIADKARHAGFTDVILTATSDAGLLAGLCAYNWSLP